MRGQNSGGFINIVQSFTYYKATKHQVLTKPRKSNNHRRFNYNIFNIVNFCDRLIRQPIQYFFKRVTLFALLRQICFYHSSNLYSLATNTQRIYKKMIWSVTRLWGLRMSFVTGSRTAKIPNAIYPVASLILGRNST